MDARREPLPPSGGQVDLAYGDQHATAVEVGGALRTNATGERDVLDGYAVDEMCSGATLWMDAAYPYLMLFTGDSLPEPERRRRSLGVEPMTCAPNAFRSGERLRALEASESFTASWGIMPSSAIQPMDPGI